MAETLPNFFVVGAGKAGTTSLHNYLAQHPDIYMSPVKEPCFFASEIRPAHLSAAIGRHVQKQTRALPDLLGDGRPVQSHGWLACEWDDYLRLFQRASGQRAIGESSAAYLWSESAPENIAARVPDARIIMILRDPAERAYSQYLHQVSVGLTRDTFRDHMRECLKPQPQLGIHHPFLEIGLYARQVQRYLDRFPRDRIRIYWYEEAWQHPGHLLADIFRFLGVDDSFAPDTSGRSLERRAPRFATAHYLMKKLAVWYPLRALVPARLRGTMKRAAFAAPPPISKEDRRYLLDYYRDDIGRLSTLLDRDLSAWLRI